MDEQNENSLQPTAPDNPPPLEPELPEQPRPRIPFVLIGFALLVILAVIALIAMWPKKAETVQGADDLGPGVYNPAGLRGHLTIQWEGRARYKLQIDPLNDQLADGFAYVGGTPDQPYALTIRVLDNAGFALCSKEILFPFDPGKALAAQVSTDLKNEGRRSAGQIAQELAQQRASLDQLKQQETQREIGKDMFQTVVNPDGKVIAVQALGDLPCSKDSYRRAYYWDFTTNFPTPDEQDALLHHMPNAIEEIQQRSERAAAATRHRRKVIVKPRPVFYVEGDDRITDYDVGNAVLETSMRKAFAIGVRAEQATAQNWANDSALIHYRCDPSSNCTLTRSGSAAVLHAHMLR